MLKAATDLHLAGRLDQAVAAYGELLAKFPGHADCLYNLGLALQSLGRLAEAEACDQACLAADPGRVDALLNLGTIWASTGRRPAALDAFSQVVSRAPNHPAGHYNLARELLAVGRLGDAITHYGAALGLRPDFAEAHLGLGAAYMKQQKVAEARSCFEAALASRPGYVEAMCNLAAVLALMGERLRALDLLGRAQSLRPGMALPHSLRGVIFLDLGRHREAVAEAMASLAIEPLAPGIHSNLLLALTYDEDITPEAMRAAAAGWDTSCPVSTSLAPHDNDRDPERRLRVGYVSADFRDHAMVFFLEPMIAAHDRSNVEVFCYSEVAVADELTNRIRATADHWRSTFGLSDEAAAAMIRADRIDVLVDCGGHTRDNRLGVFARKPAPVQVGSVLGHSASTGLRAMDAILADPWMAPAGAEREFTERLVRLPRIVAPFRPRANAPAPFPVGESMVFASFAEPSRVGPTLIAIWRALLRAVPEATLLLKHNNFADPVLREGWTAAFAEFPGRLRMETVPGGWGANMDVYGKVAVMLDTYPVSTRTSMLFPLWMGVPLVTLAGPLASSRQGASLVGCLGLEDLIAHSPEAYVEKAAALIRDRNRLRHLRATLRDTMGASALCDERGVMAEMEAVYRGLWREWCAVPG